MKNRRVPAIRFKNFTDDWEKGKLKRYGITVSGIGFPEREQGGKTGVPFYKVSDMSVVGNEYEMVQACHYVNKEQIARYKWKVIDKGSAIIFAKVGAAIFLNRKRLVKSPFLMDNNMMAFIPKSDACIDFWKSLLDRINLSTYRQEGALPSYNGKTIENIDVVIPKDMEQKHIGYILYAFEKHINLHQRKLDKLKTLKKGFLQKILPKNGDVIPVIRFIGYTDDWKTRRLGELASSFEYGLNAAAKEFDGKNKYIRITDIDDDSRKFNQNSITSPDIDLVNADGYKLAEGDILFARTGASVGKTYIYKKSDGLVYYAGFLIRARIKEEYNSEFVFQNTITEDYERFIQVISVRSGQPGVNAQEYSSFEIMAPEKEEQDRIGKYFYNLDSLVALYQRELELLQLVKKGLLQKLFVSGE